MDQDLFFRVGIPRAGVRAPFAQGLVFVAIDEVGYDLDRPQDAEIVHRFLAQVI